MRINTLAIFILGIMSIFGCKEKKNNIVGDIQNQIKAYSAMDETLKDSLRESLKRNSEKEFNSEWIRTTNLEREIVNRYGFDAIKLIFEYRNSKNYYLLGEFPEGCPWKVLNDHNLNSFIQANFELIQSKIPKLIASIQDRCEFIYTEQREDTWYLHYFLRMNLYDGRQYYRVYTGGSPNLSPKTNPNLNSFKWEIPKDLDEFYKIHDGFGEIYDANFIMSAKDIRVLGEMMNPIAEKQEVEPDGYTFNNLLEFFPDGTGNAQCFLMTKNGTNQTVDWDHETWEISEASNFYKFIDYRLSQIDEE